jgi:predicted HicB family RNase H-like nuclease
MATMANTENIAQPEEAKGKIMQITLPDDLHAELKAAAALERMGLYQFVIESLRRTIEARSAAA